MLVHALLPDATPTAMKRRPTVLVLIGLTVFVLGTALVLAGLHAGSPAAGSTIKAGSGSDAGSGSATGSRSAAAGSGSGAATGHDQSHSEVQLPSGHQAVAVTPTTAAAGLAAYLGPGDIVDVYVSIDKASATGFGTDGGAATPEAPVPCTVLVAADVPVIDVSDQLPEYGSSGGGSTSSAGSTGRTAPQSITVLLSATTAQAEAIVWSAANESVYLTEVPSSDAPAPAGTCFTSGSALGGAS